MHPNVLFYLVHRLGISGVTQTESPTSHGKEYYPFMHPPANEWHLHIQQSKIAATVLHSVFAAKRVEVFRTSYKPIGHLQTPSTVAQVTTTRFVSISTAAAALSLIRHFPSLPVIHPVRRKADRQTSRAVKQVLM